MNTVIVSHTDEVVAMMTGMMVMMKIRMIVRMLMKTKTMVMMLMVITVSTDSVDDGHGTFVHTAAIAHPVLLRSDSFYNVSISCWPWLHVYFARCSGSEVWQINQTEDDETRCLARL